MSIQLPVLDDKTYADLMQEAQASIAKIYPGWTDHNPADPGIALIELFAWLSDIMLYRLGRLTDERYVAFLRLLSGPDFELAEGEALNDAIRTTLGKVRERYRAVSVDDYDYLVRTAWPASEVGASLEKILRVKCLPERNLLASDKIGAAPAWVSLLVLPESGGGSAPWVVPSEALTAGLLGFFKNRKLITTRLCVAGPTYVPISVSATLYIKDFATAEGVRPAGRSILERYFDPISGGEDGRGFPFGGEINISKIYAILDGVRGVDFTEGVSVTTADGAARELTDGDEVLAVDLLDYELPRLDAASVQFTVMARSGDQWKQI